jgi:hypothetical protein
LKRLLAWCIAGGLVVLLARAIAYALEPSAGARTLQHSVGGPSLPVVALFALLLGVSIAIAICWLAALGVRERALLERRRLVPRFRIAHTVALALALGVATSFAGGLVEAYVHWRSGMSWHGLDCLSGPVHRDLLPLEFGLSFIAAAVVAALEHVVAWMRRTFASLRAVPFVARAGRLPALIVFGVPRARGRFLPGGARAPPRIS